MEILIASTSSTTAILRRPPFLPVRSSHTTLFYRNPLSSNHTAQRKLNHSFQISSSNVKLKYEIKCGVTEINESQFSEVVLKSDRPVLVEFVATWCGPCRLIAPVVESVAQEYEEKLLVVKIDHDSNPKLIEECKVYGLPTLIMFKDGEMIPESRREGAITKAKLKDYIDALLKLVSVA